MANIDEIIEEIIRREGGYSNHENDRGGSTKFGVTIATLKDWRDDENLTEEDVKNLTKEEAAEIYKQKYYFQPKIDRLPECIQEFVLDTAVHSGPNRAVQFVQRACNSNGFPAGPTDGVIGPRTIKAAYSFHRQFLDSLIDLRETFLLKIIEDDPTQAKFASGWMNRISSFR